MKKIIFLLLCSFSLLNIHAQSNALFENLSNDRNVGTVFVSKSLLSMMPKLNMGNADLKSISNKLTQVEIYTTENPKSIRTIKNGMRVLAANNRYERIMQVKNDGQNVVFFAEQHGGTFRDLIMFVDSDNEYTVIRLIGNFTPEDVQKVVKGN